MQNSHCDHRNFSSVKPGLVMRSNFDVGLSERNFRLRGSKVKHILSIWHLFIHFPFTCHYDVVPNNTCTVKRDFSFSSLHQRYLKRFPPYGMRWQQRWDKHAVTLKQCVWRSGKYEIGYDITHFKSLSKLVSIISNDVKTMTLVKISSNWFYILAFILFVN